LRQGFEQLRKENVHFSATAKDNLPEVPKTIFNIQSPIEEPLLSAADYFCWAIQRVFERGELRCYEFLIDKISKVNLIKQSNTTKKF
jgi:hypothetical protein